MNRFHLLIVLAVALSGCSGNETGTDKETDPISVNSPQDINSETEVIEQEEISNAEPRNFTLDEFPKKWIKLSCEPNGESCVIYHYCEAELPQIIIEPEYGDKWVLWALYGQDSESWIIKEFAAAEKEMELMQIVEGTMKLVKETDESNVTNVSFMWNKDEVFCNFTGIFHGEENFFVNEEERSYYEEEEEDCTGLWEE